MLAARTNLLLHWIPYSTYQLLLIYTPFGIAFESSETIQNQDIHRRKQLTVQQAVSSKLLNQ